MYLARETSYSKVLKENFILLFFFFQIEISFVKQVHDNKITAKNV